MSSVRSRLWPLALLCAPLVPGALAGCDGRQPPPGHPPEEAASLTDDHVAELDLTGGIPEASAASLFGGVSRSTFPDLIAEIDDIAETDEVKGVFVRLGSIGVGLARAQEVGRELARLRDKGLPVVCHADNYGNGTMLLAAVGCDEIWLSPAGGVDTVGIAAQLIFGRSLLDNLQIDVDFLQVGKYKGAEEPFTRDTASPEARQSLENALGAMRSAWIDGITEARDANTTKLGLEDGPHSAKAAKERGLIDEIGFLRDARKHALERAGVEGKLDHFGGKPQSDGGMAELVRVLSGGDSVGVPHVAVVPLNGSITMSGGGGLFGGGGGITENATGKLIRELEHDDAIRAVVLRIDSPGGSALASDLLWRAIMDLRDHKPVVVSVGGMAASGGYYLACAGSKIIVEETSIIGSIGVVAGKLSFANSLSEVGISVETVAPGPNPNRALWGSPMIAWDDSTRAKLRESIEATYDLFLERIAEGRGITVDSVAPSAEGRLMGGAQAVEAGLADEVGGLSRALALAYELGDLEADLPVRIHRDDGGLLELLGGGNAQAGQYQAGLEVERRAAARAAAVSTELLPYRDEIGRFVASTQPLLQGERVVVALPFVLVAP